MGSCIADVGLPCIIQPKEEEEKLVIIKILFFCYSFIYINSLENVVLLRCVLFQFSFKCLFVTV